MGQLKKLLTSHVIGFRIISFSFLAITLWAATQSYSVRWWLLGLVMYFVYGCLGVVITHHRYLSHHSFKLSKPKEYFLSLLAALGGTGSGIGWVSLHMAHHRYSDTPLDPHSPENGTWNMLMLRYRIAGLRIRTVRKLLHDPVHRFIHVYYNAILATWAVLLYVLGGLPLVLFMFIVPVTLTAMMSNLTNYGGHKWGYRNFNTHDTSMNNPWVAALAFGEGWHNNHHRYPGRSSYTHHWWEFDLSGWIINRIKDNK